MSKITLFQGLFPKIAFKEKIDGAMNFTTDTNELSFDYYDDNSSLVRKTVKDRSAGKSLQYSNSTLALKDADGNTLSEASIIVNPEDFTSLFINGSDGHLYYEKSDQLTGVDFAITNHSNLQLTIDS